MPRTIEHRVEMHRLVRERVAAGRSVWERTIDIKAILRSAEDDTSEETAARVANAIGALLRSHLSAASLDWACPLCDDDIAEVVEGLEQLRPDSYADDPTYSAREDLNNMLDALYDWADRNRVWLGA